MRSVEFDLHSALLAPHSALEMLQRTCIACSRKGGRDEFWRFKSKDGQTPIFDPNNKAPGRGASLCQSAVCVEKAIARRSFERALKLQEPLLSGFKDELRQLDKGVPG